MLDVVDSDPPLITNDIFKPEPGSRSVATDMGDVKFNCKNGNVPACGRRKPAQRVGGVATIQVNSTAAMNAYLAKALKLTSSDSHPW
jgi:hypothetical protein